MLEKSLLSQADSVAYDLEDAVAPAAKPAARKAVAELLDSDRRPKGECVARINAVGTGFEADDLDAVVSLASSEATKLPDWLTSAPRSSRRRHCPPQDE